MTEVWHFPYLADKIVVAKSNNKHRNKHFHRAVSSYFWSVLLRCRQNRCSTVNLNRLTIAGDVRRTFWPERSNESKPLVNHRSEASRARIFDGSQSTRKTVLAKQRDRFPLRYKTPKAQPHEEIQDSW
jgi:hypothetical protein